MYNKQQLEAINALQGRVRVIAGAGAGKCHSKGTKILMYDGTIKNIENIQVGDLLMGPDSKPRTVLSLARGTEQMYEIQPTRGGEPWGCNESHILSLKCGWTKTTRGFKICEKNSIWNVSVKQYLQKGQASRRVYRLYRTAVDFANPQTLEIDPYIYGLWLGDGSTGVVALTNKDKEIVDSWCNYGQLLGLKINVYDKHRCPIYHLSQGRKRRGQFSNKFLATIKRSTISGHKRILHEYKTASREDRLKLLAGVIDTDGYKSASHNTWEVVTKYEDLAQDYAFVARSLGFRVSVKKKQKCKFNGKFYNAYTVRIAGDLRQCPIKLERKKAQSEFKDGDPLKTSFKVVDKGIGEYYGFTLDGDHLYLLGDFTVTHNTSVLTERYIKLLDLVEPYNILCVTFTNKAAEEMKTRIQDKVGQIKDSLICTFHSFCLRVLRQYIGKFGYPNNFVILDTYDQKCIVKKLYKECNMDKDQIKHKTALEIIEHQKVTSEKNLTDLVKKDDTIKKLYDKAKTAFLMNKHLPYDAIPEIIENYLYYGYLYEQQKNTALDFNDLIIICVMLFKQFPEVLEKYQKRLHYIMVDEFQDASKRQYELVSMLSKQHGNLFVVGDPDQTIYTWRGADTKILVDFDKEKETKTIILNQNYRSTPNILDAANRLIQNNKLRIEKDLFTENKEGCEIFYYHTSTSKEEAQYITYLIKKALEKHKPKDIAILYRKHALSRAVEEQLIKQRVPYVIYSSINFYERREIKDVMCYLRLINNTQDDLAFERIINVPKRGIGQKKVENLKEYAKQHNCSLFTAASETIKIEKIKPLEDFVFMINLLHAELRVPDFDLVKFTQRVLNLSGYVKTFSSEFEQEARENVLELISSMADYDAGTTLDQYLQDVALLTNTDNKQKDAVSLMTIHAAKGLEFPIVFVIGLCNGLFPSQMAQSDEDMEEERRLMYVAMTRAKQFLFLTNAEICSTGYDIKELEDSKFLDEIDKSKLKIVDTTQKEKTTYEPKKISRKAWVIKRR